MFNTKFWQSSVETAVRAAAAAALAVITAGQIVSAVAIDWLNVGGVALLAAVVSLLTSIVVPNPDIRAVRKEASLQAVRDAEAQAKREASAARRKANAANK